MYMQIRYFFFIFFKNFEAQILKFWSFNSSMTHKSGKGIFAE